MSGKFDDSAILFDLDGTLIDTAADLGAATNAALAKLGYGPVPRSAVRNLIGNGGRAMLARGYEIVAGGEADRDVLDAGVGYFLDFYEKNIAVDSAPFPGAIASIDRLRAQGAKIAICTNKREALARRLIETLGLEDRFDVIVGADTAAAPKPDPAPVRFCLERLGAGRGVFVGDSDTDIRAAQASGLPCILVDFGYGPTELAENAAARISHFRALEAAIASTL
ncbi:MAG: HAD-IA family hydrolase [Pseudomonadota bacterium]